MLLIEIQKYIQWCDENKLKVCNASNFLNYMKNNGDHK